MGFSGAWQLREGSFSWEGISDEVAKAPWKAISIPIHISLNLSTKNYGTDVYIAQKKQTKQLSTNLCTVIQSKSYRHANKCEILGVRK